MIRSVVASILRIHTNTPFAQCNDQCALCCCLSPFPSVTESNRLWRWITGFYKQQTHTEVCFHCVYRITTRSSIFKLWQVHIYFCIVVARKKTKHVISTLLCGYFFNFSLAMTLSSENFLDIADEKVS